MNAQKHTQKHPHPGALVEYILEHGGCTIDVNAPDAPPPTRGFAVSLQGAEVQIAGDLSRGNLIAQVRAYIAAHQWENDPRVYFGAWIDGATVYLDRTVIYTDLEHAAAAAADNAQIAIYDLEHGATIYTADLLPAHLGAQTTI